MTFDDDVVASIDALVAQPPARRPDWLTTHPAQLTDAFFEVLKARADEACGSDIQTAIDLARLIQQAALVIGRDDVLALGLLAEGNAHLIGYADYDRALDRLDKALVEYRRLGRDLDAARVIVPRLYPLGRLGRLNEAYADFEWAHGVLRSHREYARLAYLLMNFGALLGDRGADREALARFDEAATVLAEIGDRESLMDIGGVEQNRSVALRNLGRFDEAIAAGLRAIAVLNETGQPIEAARAKQNLGMTYVETGHYRRGLQLVEEARDAFEGQHLPRQNLRLDLYMATCLLDLGRPQEVIDLVAKSRPYFDAHHGRLEGGQAQHLAALAHLSLGQLEAAVEALSAATDRLQGSENLVWLARVARLKAKVLARLGRLDETQVAAHEAQRWLDADAQPLERLRARLDLAELSLILGNGEAGETQLADIADAVANEPVPLLRFDYHRLLGQLASRRALGAEAFLHFERALNELDALRGHLLPEFQSDFLANKEAVYAAAVASALDLGCPAKALTVIEGRKARALVDSLRGRLRQAVRPRRTADTALVAELNQLLTERDRLVRRWSGSDDGLENIAIGETEARRNSLRQISGVERAIEERWRRLLVRSADYAADTTLTRAVTEDMDALLDALPTDTAFLTHFAMDDRLVAFVARKGGVAAHELPTPWSQVQGLIRYLHQNFAELPQTPASHRAASRREAEGLLGRLAGALLDPIDEVLEAYANIVIIPHAELHYLPFQALLREGRYLVEDRRISYLPSLGAWRHLRSPERDTPRAAVFGRSADGRLAGTLAEARLVAEIWGTSPILEDRVTLESVRDAAGRSQILHLATHGVFRPDSPLFSGLSLSDGELTTLRIFNELDLDGSLVVLSACESGRGSIGGGDELQGLMRAFLYRGASALVMTLWQADDTVATPLMAYYHQLLRAGHAKADALCQAQCAFLNKARAAAQDAYTHPFFWATFIHVGDVGPIGGEQS